MLAALLNVPVSSSDWATWSLHHKLDHDEIADGVYNKYSIRLPQHQLDPIPMDQVTSWLARNQESHNEMNAQLSLQSTDLEGVDFADNNQLRSWIYLHYQEHFTARSKLGI